MTEQPIQRSKPWWRRWWAIVLWVFIALVVIIGIASAASGGGGSASPANDSGESSPSKPPLFADATDGIQQWVGGQTMPVGTYDFDCSFGGNVSIQLGRSPYTVDLKEGDQTRTVGSGDMITVGLCKVYGPK